MNAALPQPSSKPHRLRAGEAVPLQSWQKEGVHGTVRRPRARGMCAWISTPKVPGTAGRIPSLRGGTAKNSCSSGARRGPRQRTAVWSWPVTTAVIDHRSHAERGLEERPTIHEGVAAQALERRGIISDRCELNRQIKADNALLRELKAEVKKLAALVAHTVPAVAERLEKLRSRILIFCYQLSHIRAGRASCQKALTVYKPQLTRFHQFGPADQGEKQGAQNCESPRKNPCLAWQVFKHKELGR